MNIFIILLFVGFAGWVLGYFTASLLWKQVSDSWKYLYYESKAEVEHLRNKLMGDR